MIAAVLPYAFVFIGLVLLYYGAEWLVDGSSKLAVKLGMSPLVVGLTIVAFGTSAPELVVGIRSCLAGAGNISIGNVIGSNICNVALILGLSALIRPLRVSKQLFRLDIPICAAASLLALAFLNNGGEIKVREGAALLTIFAGYIGYNVITAKKGGGQILETNNVYPVNTSANNGGKNDPVVKCAVFIVLGLILLTAGSDLLVRGAVQVATLWGVSEAVIGLTIVAVGTSLPELATSIVAAVKKKNDIAVGNIVGSNIFNLLLILGTVGILGPTAADGIRQADILLMIALALALFFPLLTKNSAPRRFGGVLVGTYIVYMVMLCADATSMWK